MSTSSLPVITTILQSGSDKIKVTLRFNVNIKEKEGQSFQVASHLLHIYKTQNMDSCIDALHNVLGKEFNRVEWLASREEEVNNTYESILKSQYDWCMDNVINFTPAMVVNGRDP